MKSYQTAAALAVSLFAAFAPSALGQARTNPVASVEREALAPVATTQYGKVSGRIDNGVNVFLGVPYGATTEGQRFQPAAPPASWDGVLKAEAYPDTTPQLEGNTAVFKSWQPNPVPAQSENMLGLNVWTPGLDDRQRPVMVWLHGGGFQSGSGSSTAYDGVRLANRGDVVVVTINHRLNALGYLYLAGLTDDPKYADSGNIGNLDMVQALKWVRDNIAQFGGNPDNVTIFGESGGGRKVSVLMAMPSAEGLFHRAIVESGSMLAFRTPEEATEGTKAYLNAIGVSPDNLDALQEKPVAEIVEALKMVGDSLSTSLYWGPVVDGRSLPKDPWTGENEANRNVPMLIGSNKDELSLWIVNPANPKDMSREDALKRLAAWAPDGADQVHLYDGYAAIHPDHSPREVLIDIASDLRYSANAVAQAKAKARLGAAPAWLYQFDWETPVVGGALKTPHALEIAFAFDNLANSESMVGAAEPIQHIADQVSEAWISFARHGDPNARGLPYWPRVSPSSAPAMRFNSVSRVDGNYFDAEQAVLDTRPAK